MLAASSTMIHTRSQAVCMVWVYLLSMHSQNGSMSRYTETARYTTRATGMAHPQVKWKPQVLLQIQVQRSRSCQALRYSIQWNSPATQSQNACENLHILTRDSISQYQMSAQTKALYTTSRVA